MALLMPNKKETTYSALMYRLEVYSQNGYLYLGTGYAFYHKWGMSAPTLIGLTGEVLPQGWYTLKVTDETGQLVVVSERIH